MPDQMLDARLVALVAALEKAHVDRRLYLRGISLIFTACEFSIDFRGERPSIIHRLIKPLLVGHPTCRRQYLGFTRHRIPACC